MKKIEHAHRIGDEAFIVRRDGILQRTAVKSLAVGGERLFISADRNFFDFDEAVNANEELIRRQLASDDITKRDEVRLKEILAKLRTPSFRDHIFQQDLVDGGGLPGLSEEEVLGRDILFPTEYFLPGQWVFGLVTPTTHYTMSPAWRPRPYFLLKVKVQQVSFAKQWPDRLLYRFAGTWYTFSHGRLFATEKIARTNMVDIFAIETYGSIKPENIPTFRISDERAYWQGR